MDEREFKDRYASMMRSLEVMPDLKEKTVAHAFGNLDPSSAEPCKTAGEEASSSDKSEAER